MLSSIIGATGMRALPVVNPRKRGFWPIDLSISEREIEPILRISAPGL
jgi:hypothetical protein